MQLWVLIKLFKFEIYVYNLYKLYLKAIKESEKNKTSLPYTRCIYFTSIYNIYILIKPNTWVYSIYIMNTICMGEYPIVDHWLYIFIGIIFLKSEIYKSKIFIYSITMIFDYYFFN